MNYMNLATARSAGRAREVGLRKVVGSPRRLLILQFLSESILLTFISLIISLVLLMILLPKFNLLAGKSFDLSIVHSQTVLLSLLSIILIVGILGGTYPAFFLSRFTPVTVLKGEITQGSAGNLFRKILVVTQFTISVAMIICTLVVFRQLNYLKTMDQGFNQKNVIGLQLNREMVRKYQVLKEALLENPEIKSVTATDTPVGEGSGKLIFNVETDQGMSQRGINFAVVDHDFIRTLGITIVDGRDFQQDMPSDTLSGVIVNETFVKRMGWTDPLGKKIEAGDENTLRARVIGVMKDYHQTGMYNEIESLLLAYQVTGLPIIYIKLGDENIQQALSFVEAKWKEIFPDQPYSYTFLSERFNRQFEADEKRGLIFTLFTVLAILIACLGLFGLASYTVEQRTKEIGIRKVFGANEGTILRLVIRDFLILVTIGTGIAIPAAYYFMTNWLSNYVYRTTIEVQLLVYSALLTIFATFITVSYKAYQASILNPASSLKTE
jgi:putative ABC transport system permease protein